MLLIGKTAARIRPRDDPGPRYTEEARKSRIQGRVILRTVIDEEGNVAAARVRASTAAPFSIHQAASSTWPARAVQCSGVTPLSARKRPPPRPPAPGTAR